MIDFRYHLVSLISVFMALAVGIALGAGPLKETIGDSLTGQVDQLRAEKDALRAELDATTVELQQTETSLGAVAPALLDGVLGQRRVAIVVIDDVPGSVVDDVVAQLAAAGGSVSATVQVNDAWVDPERRSFRQSLAGTLLEYLDPVPAETAGTGTELAEALAQGLTTASPDDPDVLADDAGVVLELLSGDAGLISLAGEVTQPADAIVLLVGPTTTEQEAVEAAAAAPTPDPEESAAAAELAAATVDAAVQIATAAQSRSGGAVVAGGAPTDGSVLTELMDGEATAARLSTVEAVTTLAGQISVPLALSARISGVVGHYGPSSVASAPMPPRVELPPIERVPLDAGAEVGAEAGGSEASPTAPTDPAPTEPAPTETQG